MSAGPSTVSAPSAEVPLACHADPDQWFDSGARTASLAGCLACPHRRWCAQRALNYQPRWGMWAGIWINGSFDAVSHFFDLVATDTPLPHHRDVEAPSAPKPPAPQGDLVIPRGVSCSAGDRVAPHALVWARASGHCEIMSTGCQLSADSVASRIPGSEGGGASGLFAVCARCAETLKDLDPQIARRLGYRVDNFSSTLSTPFFWRQTRRILLCPNGALHDAVRPNRQPHAVAT